MDKPLQKRIQALRVKCSYHDNGCDWKGELRELPVCPPPTQPHPTHLQAHVQECDYAVIECPKKCGDSYERRFHETHITEDCARRMVDCQYCKKEIKHEQLEEHYRACTNFPLDCPNGCSKIKYPREEVSHNYTIILTIAIPLRLKQYTP